MLRFGTIRKGHKGDLHIERGLTFDDFVHCCIKLRQAIDLWNYMKDQAAGAASSSLNMNNSFGTGMKYGAAGYGRRTPSPVPGYSNYGKSPSTAAFTLDDVSVLLLLDGV